MLHSVTDNAFENNNSIIIHASSTTAERQPVRFNFVKYSAALTILYI